MDKVPNHRWWFVASRPQTTADGQTVFRVQHRLWPKRGFEVAAADKESALQEAARRLSEEGDAAWRPPPPVIPTVSRPPQWRLVLELLGGSTGLALFVTFVGGAMLWGRFNALGLPADRAVAAVPREVLVSAGAHALAAPIAAGLAAALLLYLVNPLDAYGQPRRRVGVILFLLIVGGGVVVFRVIDLDLWPQGAAVGTVSVLAALAVWLTAKRTVGYRAVAWTVFAGFAVVGGALAYARTTGAPKMEPAAVLLKRNSEGVSGFYLGQTSDRLYLAPLTSGGQAALGEDVSGVLEIPRDQVVRLAVRAPASLGPDAGGRAEALALLQELRNRRELVLHPNISQTAVIATDDPASTFAPLVNLHAAEDYWPMSADYFLANSWLAWAHGNGCPDYLVSLDDHIPDQERASHRKELLGQFDPARLAGEHAYTHTPVSGSGCEDANAPSFAAGAHTRPFDLSGRDPRLPKDEGFYLDLADDKRQGARNVSEIGAQTRLEGVPAYYTRQPAETPDEQKAIRITYWFLYGRSVPPGPDLATRFVTHEGDWEGVSVLAQRVGRDRYTPLFVRYNVHDGHIDLPWFEAERVSDVGSQAAQTTVGGSVLDATHPVAYSAEGSHATYPALGSHEIKVRPRGIRLFGVHDEALACFHCPQWQTWRDLVNARREPWYGFGGAWGQVGTMKGTTAPLGPSSYKLGGLEAKPPITVQAPPP